MEATLKLGHADGKITALDPEKRSLRLGGLIWDMEFETPSIASLMGLRPGDRVRVYYEKLGSQRIAHYVAPVTQERPQVV